MKKRRYGLWDFAIDFVFGIFTGGLWWGYRLLELPYKLIFRKKK